MTRLNLVVTGRPGIGKSTLVEHVIRRLRGTLRLAGFTTTEVRDPSGDRLGFDIVTVNGTRGPLARVKSPSPVRVGRYGVALQEFERIALPELERRDADLLVIDEIGKMECSSDRFRHVVEQALDAPGLLLATLGIGHLPFFKKVRERIDVELITITELNRDGLVAELCKRITKEHLAAMTADTDR